LDDFSKVLRKKHAIGAVLLAEINVGFGDNYSVNTIPWLIGPGYTLAATFSRHRLTHSPAMGVCKIWGDFGAGLICAFCPPDRQRLRSRFRGLWRCDSAFTKHAAFVITRSDGDQAIQFLYKVLDCFASAYALRASADSCPP
jgi:hypothetical protein